MSWSDQSPYGLVGLLTVATQEDGGLGEVTFPIRGGTETFVALSDQVLPKGQQVVCVEDLGGRVVRVAAWGERIDSPLKL